MTEYIVGGVAAAMIGLGLLAILTVLGANRK